MTRVRINYDGWLSLPTAVRQKLGLATGDQLELELSDGDILLRPVRAGAAEATPAPVATAEPSIPAAPPAAAAAAPMVKRGPGRPRKTPLPVVPPTLKARDGRARSVVTSLLLLRPRVLGRPLLRHLHEPFQEHRPGIDVDVAALRYRQR